MSIVYLKEEDGTDGIEEVFWSRLTEPRPAK